VLAKRPQAARTDAAREGLRIGGAVHLPGPSHGGCPSTPHTLAAARRILALEDDLAAGRALTAVLHSRPGEPDASDR